MGVGLWIAALAVAHLLSGCGVSRKPAFEELVMVSRPGPWPAVSELIGYQGKLWFANSVKFINHNSADIYSYDPQNRRTRFERHMFSQDAGAPTIHNGYLYWPFEDPRFSTRRGEFFFTDGETWRWGEVGVGQAFHLHALVADSPHLYAALSAWRARIAVSSDGGNQWQLIYEHPTPSGQVSRFTALSIFDGHLYAGLTQAADDSTKLYRLYEDTMLPVSDWPDGNRTDTLFVHRDWLYAVNAHEGVWSVWRTNGERSEPVDALSGKAVRDFATLRGDLFVLTGANGEGALWRLASNGDLKHLQRFDDAEPIAMEAYAGVLYVGTNEPGGNGALWATHNTPLRVADRRAPTCQTFLDANADDRAPSSEALSRLDSALLGSDSFADYRNALDGVLRELLKTPSDELGEALGQRLQRAYGASSMSAFGGAYEVTLERANRWYLLWALAKNGRGRVPPAYFAPAWASPPNRAQKYLEPLPAAVWAATVLKQNDRATIAALIERLAMAQDPNWLTGDIVGALAVLTDERFGYDTSAWKRWWETVRDDWEPPMPNQ